MDAEEAASEWVFCQLSALESVAADRPPVLISFISLPFCCAFYLPYPSPSARFLLALLRAALFKFSSSVCFRFICAFLVFILFWLYEFFLRFLLLCFGVVLRSSSFTFLFYYFPFFLNSSLCILCIVFAQLRLLLARRTTCLHAPIAIIPPTASKLSTATSPSLISCPCFSAASTATKKTYFSIIRYYCQQLYP